MNDELTEELTKAALLQRVQDIYRGAAGWPDEDEEWTIDLESFGRVFLAMMEVWPLNNVGYHLHHAGEFENPAKATEHLWRNGARP